MHGHQNIKNCIFCINDTDSIRKKMKPILCTLIGLISFKTTNINKVKYQIRGILHTLCTKILAGKYASSLATMNCKMRSTHPNLRLRLISFCGATL